MFEKASKLKLRFSTPVGSITVEDLWDVQLTGNPFSLDSIARNVNKQLKLSEEESFVEKKTKINNTLELKLDIVKHIIAVKLANAEKAEKSAETKAKKQRVLAILSEKQDDALKGKTEAELEALLDSL